MVRLLWGRSGVGWLLAAAVLPLLAIAAVLPRQAHAAPAATALVNCDVDSSQLYYDSEEMAAFSAVNNYRASKGLNTLQYSAALTQIAAWKSSDMATYRYNAHDDVPWQRSYQQRVVDCGYATQTVAFSENLAGCNASGTATVTQWQNSPEHNANMLDPQFVAMGLARMQGMSPDGRSTCWYWSLELGTLTDADLAAGAPAASPDTTAQ